MACTLSNKCAKNLSKQTVLLQLIIKNVVICFFGTQCSMGDSGTWTLAYWMKVNCLPTELLQLLGLINILILTNYNYLINDNWLYYHWCNSLIVKCLLCACYWLWVQAECRIFWWISITPDRCSQIMTDLCFSLALFLWFWVFHCALVLLIYQSIHTCRFRNNFFIMWMFIATLH